MIFKIFRNGHDIINGSAATKTEKINLASFALYNYLILLFVLSADGN